MPDLSPQKFVQCACPEHADPVACIDLRYHGYSPGPNSERDRAERDECECFCHDVAAERERDAEDEANDG